MINTKVFVLESKDANSAGEVRERIDAGFASKADWTKTVSGGIDWVKRIRYNCSIVSRLGVEVQVSGRSDLLARDIIHIRNALQKSDIDVGVIIVPSDCFENFLTDRVANYSYAMKYVTEELPEAQMYAMIVIGIEHDGPSDVHLKKKTTNMGTGSKKKKPAKGKVTKLGRSKLPPPKE